MNATPTKRKSATIKRLLSHAPELSHDVSNENHNDNGNDNGNELPELKQVDRIIEIELAKIKPHEHNRSLASDESIDDLAESIRVMGQIEPATVRELFSGKHSFELLSGERRYRALQKLGRKTIRAVVAHDDSVEGLVRLAAANSQRRDLNAIERAELIVQLMQPKTKGGSGLSREAAGKACGLNSESGTKNALRMLKLPDSIKTLVVSGELSERASRKLIPFVDHPEICKAIEKSLVSNEHRVELAAEEGWPYWLEEAIENNTRPLDDHAISARDLVKGCYSQYPMLFDATAELLEKLQPFDLHDGNETRRVTANTKLWDELQKPLVAAKFNDQRSPQQSAKATDKKQLTPAQEKAEKARKAREAKERIDNYTVLWITYALRCQLATSANADVRMATLGYLVQAMNVKYDINRSIDRAYKQSQIKVKRIGVSHGYEPEVIPELNEDDWIQYWWGNMLWPLTTAKEILPDLEKLPSISGQAVRLLATRCKIAIKDAWADAAVDGSQQRHLLALWFGRHTSDQLQAMCVTMGKITTFHKRSDLVEFLLSHHQPNKLLQIPKGLIDGAKL